MTSPTGWRARCMVSKAAFCRKLAQACETTAANTIAASPSPELIHPGVMSYFREIGVTK